MRSITSILIVILFAGCLPGCAWFKSEASTAGTSLEACAKTDLNALVGSGSGIEGTLLADVTAILIGGAIDYQAQLIALGTTVGIDAVKCAVQTAVSMLEARSSAVAGSAEAHGEPEDFAAIARGQTFLAGESK